MKQITFEDQILEVTDEELLLLIQRVLQGGQVLFQTIFHIHSSGFPDVMGKWQPWIFKERKQLFQLASQVNNERVRETCLRFYGHLQELEEINRQLVEIVADHFNFSMPQNIREQAKLKQKMDELSSKNGPVWSVQQKYKNCILKEEKIFQTVEQMMRFVDKLPDNPPAAARSS